MEYKVTNLLNNIRVATCSNESAESVSLGFFVDIGERYETLQNNGISHFLEHMLFKGTTSRSPKEIAESIENLGGYMNAYTTNETTAYYVKILKDDIKTGFEILSDMILNPIFQDIEKEKQVVVQEINQVYDSPSDIIFDYFQSACFKNQKLGMPVLGPEDNVKNFTKNDLQSHLNNYFSNKKIIISCAGAVNHNELVKIVEENFIKFIKPRNDVISPDSAFFSGNEFIEHRENLEQSHVVIGFEGPKRETREYYLFSAFSSIFGGGMSSKLFQEIRESLGLAYSVYSFISSFKETGIFGVYAGTDHDKYQKVIDVTLHELRNFTISDEELLRAKNQMKASFLMSDESNFSIAERMAFQLFTKDRIIPRAETLDIINSISKDDILSIKTSLLNSQMTTTVITK